MMVKKIEENTLQFQDYSIHFTKISTKPIGKTAVYLHGMCMYSAFYYGLTDLLPEDFAHFYFIDMPHHGRSSGEKGFLPEPSIVLNCLDFVLTEIKKQDKLEQIDLMSAESMGGVFALYYLLNRDPEPVNKYLLFGAPIYPNWGFFFTDLKQPQTTLCALFAKNKMILPVKKLLGDMTRNAAVYDQIKADPLVPDFANINYLLTILTMIREINARYDTISKDVLFFFGQKDAISNLKKIRKQNQPMKNLETIVVPEEFHSIFWADPQTYRGIIKQWLA